MPSPQHYSERREAYCAWLTANNINPSHVLRDADVYIETDTDGTQRIVYEGCQLDSEGRKQLNERGDGVAIEPRTTPLLVEPPSWWEPYRKPTRDQLLSVLDRVRTLADDGPPAGTGIGGEWEGGWESAMEAVKNVLNASD